MACECDYSYTCPECRAIYDAQNALEFANELRNWTVTAIQEIAKKLKIELPEPPQPRDH